jgi:hypothetical protein
MFYKIKPVKKTFVISYSDFNEMFQYCWERLKLIFLECLQIKLTNNALLVSPSATREHLNGSLKNLILGSFI